MRLIGLAVMFAFCAFAPRPTEGQQTGKVYRVGFLSLESQSASLPETSGIGFNGLRRGLRDLGWIEGGNLLMEGRWTEGKPERLAGFVADLIRLNVDVIVTTETSTAVAAKKATTTVPIVTTSADPVAAGLVASFAKPGGNVTGMALQTVEGRVKAIQIFLEAVPGISEIGFLVIPDNPASVRGWQATQVETVKLGVKLRRFDATQPGEVERAIATMARERIGAMVVPAFDRYTVQRGLIGTLAAKYRLPWLASYPEFAEAGALMSYGPDHRDVWRSLSRYVDKILKGAKPADLPVEQPTKFWLAINLQRAKALGLTIPPSVLGRADQVIQQNRTRPTRLSPAIPQSSARLRQAILCRGAHAADRTCVRLCSQPLCRAGWCRGTGRH